MAPRKPMRGMSFYLVLLIVIIVISMTMSRLSQPQSLSLSDLINKIDSGQVTEVIVNGYTLEVTERQGTGAPVTYRKQISPMWMPDVYMCWKKAKTDGKIQSYDYVEPTDFTAWANII
jgi:ATP-dependent Zn protease